MEPVRSTRNPRVAQAVRLRRARDRKELGLTVLEGPHVVEEARRAGVEMVEVFGIGPGPSDFRNWTEVTQDVLDRLAETSHPRGPVAVIRIPPVDTVNRDHYAIDVGDPGNAGTLIRTAAAFGLDVVFTPGSVDPWSPKVLRAAAGAHFRTSIGEPPASRGTIATVVEGGIPPHRLGEVLDPGRTWAVLIGSEAHGLSSGDVASADIAVTIPMPGGVESLNAAVAGAIVGYELGRWRYSEGTPAPNR